MIKYLQANIGKGREAQDLLLQEAREKESDILIISEHYKKPENGSWYQDTTARAAIAILNPNLKIDEVGDSDANFVWAQIDGIRIYSCYFSPNEPIDVFLRDLDKLEESFQTANCQILVAGDFNSKSSEWGSKKLDRRGEAVSEMISRFDLIILNDGYTPTFRRGNKSSRVDITLASANIAARASDWKVKDEETLSDHAYIEYTIHKEPGRKEGPKKTEGGGWVVQKLDKEKLKKSIEEIKSQGKLTQIVNANDWNSLLEFTVNTINMACDVAMPKKKGSNQKRKPVYWWTSEIAELRKVNLSTRRKLQRARGKPEEEILEEEYKLSRKKLRSAIKKSKLKCWKELCRSVEEDPWGLPYKIVTKKLLGGQQIPGMTRPEKVKEIIKYLFPTHEERRQTNDHEENNNVPPFTIEELRKAKELLKTGKAPGPDQIPNEAIIQIIEIWPNLLLEVYNSCLNKGIFPERWKEQKLVLLRKGQKPLNEPSSYRPICLLDTLGKLLERLILQRLEKHIEEMGGISQRQFGFRKGRSTVDAIKMVIDEAESIKNIPGRKKGFCALITLDIKNAFNSVSWKEIIDALKILRTPQYLITMVDSYLYKRKILYNTEEGEIKYNMTAGVPQGSILGPLLWNIMYDGLLNIPLPENSTIIGFADDVALLITASTAEVLEVAANDTIRRANAWLNNKGLELAHQKTEAVLITNRRSFTPPVLSLNDEIITWKKSAKYLGVILDSKLKYDHHIKMATEKAASTAAALARLMPNIGGPGSLKRKLLNSVVHAKMLYGAEIWGDEVNKQRVQLKLAAVQRRSVIRVISGFRTISKSAALVLAATPPIELLVQERQEIYREKRGISEQSEKAKIKKAARLRLLNKWQENWDNDASGRWTHKLIPDIASWCNRSHGELEYHLTQALTGHGCFNEYLKKFKHRQDAACSLCGHAPDNAKHTIFECKANEVTREDLNKVLGDRITEDSLIANMLKGETQWAAVSTYIIDIMKIKRKAEQEERKVDIPAT